jgi:hypothetical protein
MSQYDDIIQQAASRFNVDPALIRGVIGTESHGNAGAVSNKGAVGLMQIEPSNYESLGITDPKDPTQNIMGGTKMLAGLLDKYGDVTTALRHYQGGDDTSQWGPVNAAYPSKVFAAGGISMPQKTSQTLPGIPVDQTQGALSDDQIFSSFSKGSAPQQQTQGPNDDQILAAFTVPQAAKPSQNAAAPAQQPAEQPGALESALIGFGKGVGNTVAGTEQLLGKGASAVGLNSVGNYLNNDANWQLGQIKTGAAPAEAAHPITTGIGNLAGSVAATAPLAWAAPEGAGLLGLAGRGAVSGGAMGAVSPVDPNNPNFAQAKLGQIGTGAALGFASPYVASGVASLGRYAGDVIGSAIQPFTSGGQQQIAQNILARAAQGGPTALNMSEMVPGSAPTLAEATANPGIATLQRTMRDVNPNPFIAQEQQQATSRLAMLGHATGTPADIEAAQAARDADASQALSTVFQNAKPANAQPVVDTIDSILNGPSGKRPAVSNTLNQVRNLMVDPKTDAAIPDADPSMLYNSVRKGINDMIDSKMATSNPAGIQASRELLQVRDALDGQIEQAAPGFQNYLNNYSAASRPIDAMQYLQGLNLTNAQGDVTLAKVQNALSSLQKTASKPGANAAQSVTPEQIDTLTSIRDDLLRSGNAGLGKSVGSATAQNLATQNMVQSALPGKLGAMVGKLPAGTVGGTIGTGLGYLVGGPVGATIGSGAGAFAGRTLGGLANASNDAIQGHLLNMLLNPSLAAPALNRVASPALPFAARPAVQSLLTPAIINSGIGLLNSGGQRP